MSDVWNLLIALMAFALVGIWSMINQEAGPAEKKRAARISGAKRKIASAIQRLTSRRVGFFSPPILAIAISTAALIIVFSGTHSTLEDRANTLRTLLQIESILLGMNMIGLTINVNQFGQSTNIRTLLSNVGVVIEPLYAQLYNAHPRDQKLQRHLFISFIACSTSIDELQLRSVEEEHDYFVYRPGWDGVWYQLIHSPFVDHNPKFERRALVALHESAIIAIRLIKQILEMRSSGCCLLSKNRGSNGTRWFLETLEKSEAVKVLAASESVPVTVRPKLAALYINLSLDSGHYVQEEFREQLEELNWEPAKITHFACFCVRHALWMGFLWNKLQLFRAALISRRKAVSLDAVSERVRTRMGTALVYDAKPKLHKLEQSASAEFGVARRFWMLRQAAIPGIGWAMMFLAIAAVIWPVTASLRNETTAISVFSATYGVGLVALLESLVFAGALIWGLRAEEPFKPYGSRPP
jgi:hypothetical protein